MYHRSLRLVGLGLLALAPVSTARADSAAQATASFTQGSALLEKGDLDGALKAWGEAARTDSTNPRYREQYVILRQVTTIRQALDKETNLAKWQANARPVRSFYYAHKLYTQALELDRKGYEKAKSAESATLLGETLLKLDKNSDAETLLSSQDAAQLSPKGTALLGLAVARQKKTEQAKTLIGKLSLPADADATLLLTVAQLQALVGDTKTAAELLARSLELTPPSRIEAARADISQSKDFQAIAATAEFKAALATASKVSESKCSTGKDCGSCKSKGKCSVSSKPAADPTK